MAKKTLTQRTEENKKYRIKKTIRDVNAPMGTDYTPERFDGEFWVQLSPACYKEEEAIAVLGRAKSVDDVKVEYIYPKL